MYEIEEKIENLIYEIRGEQVIIDSDLATLYKVETKRINEAVKNNPEKFPERFSWVLTEEEMLFLRSKISTLKKDEQPKRGKHRKYNIRVFTEQGVAMIATILKSKIAIKTSIAIMDAFVGKSGAGKTTIFSLLCKLYNIEKGKIKIDGIDINELDEESIRGNITIISQSPYIFNMSIKDNLRLVKENVTDEEIKEACRLACLDDYIETLPDKYDTIVGESGVILSGGQRQRLAIARAFIQNTKIILFDEATSALDNETQSKIQKAIDNLKNDYTILIIAHRLSTIKGCDKIYLIEDGKVNGIGTHEELLKNNKPYKRLYEAEIDDEDKAY